MFAPLLDLVDLVLPHRCGGCGSPLGVLCPGCLPAGAGLTVEVGGLRVAAAAAYDASVRTALLAYKERGRRDLAGPLGTLLARAVAGSLSEGRAPPGAVALVPVPSARSVAAARGGDHVLRLARRASRATGLPVAARTLRLARAVEDSAGLSAAERAANVGAAMLARAGRGARPGTAGPTALLVDDIVTTGATLLEAKRALGTAGWSVVGAAVVAATPRWGSRRGRQGTGRA